MRNLAVCIFLALTFVSAANAGFTNRDKANATALLRLTAAGSKRWVRCGFATNPHTGRYLKCLSYTHPALATRYYHETHWWQYTGAGLILTYQREGKTILVAKVRGISRASFLIQSLICAKGTSHPC